MLQFLINYSQMFFQTFKSELELVITLMSELTLDNKPRPNCEVHNFKGNKGPENSDHPNFEDLILDFENLNNFELDNSVPVQDTAAFVPEFWEFCYKKHPNLDHQNSNLDYQNSNPPIIIEVVIHKNGMLNGSQWFTVNNQKFK